MSLPRATEAVVIGAGPAGLAAAAVLAAGGAATLVVDERPAPGGLQAASAATQSLLRRCHANGATIRSGGVAWHLTEDRTLWVSEGGRSTAVRSRIVILATGAMERPLPLPGWTLPGVFAAAGLRAMMTTAGLVPSGRLVLIGCGGLLYDAARQCLEQGAPPLAILDITPPGRLHGALRLVPREAGRDEVRAAVALRRMLREAGIRVLGGVTSCRLVGTDGVAAVAFVHRGERETIDCDMVGLHAGLVPATQFARLIGCRLRWNAGRCCFEPEVDTYGNTSVGGVLIAGDGAGIEDGGAAACRGEMSGWEALRHLGRITTGERDRGCVPLLRERAARRAVRPMLEHLETPAEAVLRPADEVMACRCEEVTAGAIRAAAAEGVRHVDELKGALRCGMGPCQGRICGAIAAALVAEGSGRTMDEVGLFRVRVPLKPIPMREMAECSLTAGAGAAAN